MSTNDAARKAPAIKKFQRDPKDTGSPEVQIAILSGRIAELTEHMKVHKKDLSSRHGLLKMVSQRRKLLAYVRRNNEELYQKILKDLGIRG